MDNQQEDQLRIRAAFPFNLSPNVDVVLDIVQRHPLRPDRDAIAMGNLLSFKVGTEFLHIPSRQYYLEPKLDSVKTLSVIEQTILACLFTRNYDGFIRQKYLEKIVTQNEEWVIPYIFQLVGEYVVEITNIIWTNLENLDKPRYINFGRENPRFMDLTRRRVLSYWAEYYRSQYNNFADYPGYKVLNALGLWGEAKEARNLLNVNHNCG